MMVNETSSTPFYVYSFNCEPIKISSDLDLGDFFKIHQANVSVDLSGVTIIKLVDGSGPIYSRRIEIEGHEIEIQITSKTGRECSVIQASDGVVITTSRGGYKINPELYRDPKSLLAVFHLKPRLLSSL